METLFENGDFAVINKPAGLLVHPAPGHEGEATVTEWFVKTYPESRMVGSEERPGVVHRLDQDTSGVMVLAKTQEAYLKLRRLFERHDQVEKTYLAVQHGTPKPKKGTVEEPVKGKRAVSHYEVLNAKDGVSLVEWKIETGRTHQIRIHAAKIGHPIVGDKLYGSARKDGQMKRRPARTLLHAVELKFGKYRFAAEPPEDILYPGGC